MGGGGKVGGREREYNKELIFAGFMACDIISIHPNFVCS